VNDKVTKPDSSSAARFDKTLYVFCVLLGAIPCGIGGYLFYTKVWRQADNLLAEAGLAEARGDRSEAANLLGAYVGKRPKDTETLVRYAILRDDLSKSDFKARRDASYILARALGRAPDRTDLRRRLVRAALELKQLPLAEEHLQILKQSTREDADLAHLFGIYEEASGNYEDAAVWFDRACQHAPNRIDSHIQLARLLTGKIADTERGPLERKLGRSADQVINRMVAVNPGSARALMMRALYRRKFRGSVSDINADLAKAYELAPNDIDVILARASWASENRRLDEARTYLERGLVIDPKHAKLTRNLVALELQANRPGAAIRRLREAVERSPEDKYLAWTLADLLIQKGEVKESDQLVGKMRGDATLGPKRVGYLDAGLLMREGDWLNAAVLFDRSSADPELKAPANRWLLQCYKHLGDLDQQLATSQKLVGVTPRWPRHHFDYGFTLLALNRVNEAIIQFQEATKLRPQWVNAWLALARSQLLHETRRPEIDRSWTAIDDVLERTDRLFPNSVPLRIVRAETLAAKGQHDLAQTRLQEAKAKWPYRIECWLALARMAQRRGRSAEALSILDEAQLRLGNSVDVRLGRARYWAQQGGAEALNAVLDQAKFTENFSREDRRRLLEGLAVDAYRIGFPAQAERLWNQIADLEPGDLRLRILLFELASQAGNQAEMERIIGEIRRACVVPSQVAPPTEESEEPTRDPIRERLVRLTAVGSTPERTQLLETYLSEVERDQEWAINEPVAISILYLANATTP
jgi:predicted Zn-dependent protease